VIDMGGWNKIGAKLKFLYLLSATHDDFSNQVCKYALVCRTHGPTCLSTDTIYA